MRERGPKTRSILRLVLTIVLLLQANIFFPRTNPMMCVCRAASIFFLASSKSAPWTARESSAQAPVQPSASCQKMQSTGMDAITGTLTPCEVMFLYVPGMQSEQKSLAGGHPASMVQQRCFLVRSHLVFSVGFDKLSSPSESTALLSLLPIILHYPGLDFQTGIESKNGSQRAPERVESHPL